MTVTPDSDILGFRQISTGSGLLALIGGTEFTEGCTFDQHLLKVTGAKRVAVVPTAAAFENPQKVIDNAKQYFSTLGVVVDPIMILKREDASNSDFIDQINEAEVIYITGGSPLHLVGVLKATPALSAIEIKWRSGTALAASSAGAMAIGDPMIDPRGGAFTVGLKLINNFTVIPHFDSGHIERNNRSLKFAPKNTLLIGIEEKTALIRNLDGTWETLGAGSGHFFLNHESNDISVLN